MKNPKCIAISGIDGTGKTTLANYLVRDLELRGYQTRLVWIKSEHTFAYLISRILIALGWRRRISNPNGIIVTRLQFFDNWFTRKIWPLIEFFSVLPLVIVKVKLPLLFGRWVVLDRYTIDTIVSVSLKTEKARFENTYLARILLNMIPRNCVPLLLDVDLATMLKRRPDIELSSGEIERGMKLYRSLSKRMNAISLNTGILTQSESMKKIIDLLFPSLIPGFSIKHGTKLYYSIVIPTYNRTVKLKRLLLSIPMQEMLPSIVVVIDQSDDLSTLELTKTLAHQFIEKRISLKYLHTNEKNGSRARNLGVKYSNTSIVFFIDDDIVLPKDYAKGVLEVYKNFPDAVGVQGLIANPAETLALKSLLDRLENQLRRAFFLSHYSKGTWTIMPSTNDNLPFPITSIIRTQRMQGCCSYRREVLDFFRFDEKLEGWSFLEDLDLSYRIFKSNIGSLYLTTKVRVIHDEHLHMSGSPKVEAYKKIVHRTYVFSKLFEPKLRNYIIFCWGVFGFLLTTSVGTIVGRHKEKNKRMPIYLVEATLFTMKHIREIRQLDLKFLSHIR